jgi:uncharacterized protein
MLNFTNSLAAIVCCTMVAAAMPNDVFAQPVERPTSTASAFAKPVISAKAEAALRKRAESGDAAAQFELGLLVFQRMLASKIPFEGHEEALRWFTLAEQNGNVSAKARLAFMILWGKPTPSGRDYVRAHRLAEEGAAANDPLALDLLSSMYYLGQGVSKDEGKAVVLEVRAADAGSLTAQRSVANRYLRGNVLEKDPAKGELYLERAASAGDQESQTTLGSLYAFGSKWGIPERPERAVYWLTTAANAQHARAQFLLGAIYCEGLDGVKADVSRAKMLLRKAIAQGQEEAREALKDCGSKR